MAFNDKTFQFGDTLTASDMNVLNDNFASFAELEDGTPKFLCGSKVYVCFDASASIKFSKGVSSVSKNGTGDFTINWSSNFSHSVINSVVVQNYGILVNALQGTPGQNSVNGQAGAEQGSNSVRIWLYRSSSQSRANVDPNPCLVMTFD